MNTPRVTKVSENSDFCELTWFLFSSFTEKERKVVEDILIKRENGLKDEFKKVEYELEKEKKNVEEFTQHCCVLENEVKKMREDCEKEVEKMKKHCDFAEKEGVSKHKKLEDELKRLRGNYVKVLDFVVDEKKRVEELKEHCRVVEKEGCLKQKMWDDEAEKMRDGYEKELEKERGFVAQEKKKVEKLTKSQTEFKVKMKERCGVVERQGRLKEKALEDEVKRLRESYEKESDLMKNKLSLASIEKRELDEKMNEHCDVLEKEGRLKEKMWEDELKRLKESYEKELEKERAFVHMEKKKVEKLEEHCEDIVNEGKLKKKIWEKEVKRLRENYEKELEKERGLMKQELSLASIEKIELEDKMARESERFEMEREAMQKTLKAELEKLGECHKKELEKEIDFMEKKLSWVVLEKLTLEEELRKKRSLEKSREYYEEELKRERDISENKLALATSEKMNLVDIIEVLESKNSNLNKELELYKERFCKIGDVVKQIKRVYDSTVNGKVRASEGLSLCKSREREKRGCSFLEDEIEDGGYNDNTIRCKRRRTDVEENTERALVCHKGPFLNDISRELDAVDGIGRCSAHSRVDSRVDSSENKEVEGVRTSNETTWSRPADMVSAFKNDPELCMAAVCTLYRQHISAGNPSTREILRGVDIHSTTNVAKFLVKEYAENKLSRSVLEVQRGWLDGPYVLQTCEKLAIRYKEQLFEIYQKKLDPFFCTKS